MIEVARPPRARPISAVTVRRRQIDASFDSAEPNRHTDRYWAQARNQSANTAASPEARRKLRVRARYEVANNSVASGIVRTLVNDVIGTGPRLQLSSQIPENRDAIRMLERSWRDWWSAAMMTAKLRTMFHSRVVDGEGVGFFRNRGRPLSKIGLDLVVVEADRLSSPFGMTQDGDIDGVKVDEDGYPVGYSIAKTHPADAMSFGVRGYDHLPPDRVIHFFRPDRAEQARGLPYLTPALNLFAQLRRYTIATLTAAETASMFAGVLEIPAPPFGEAGDEDEVELPQVGDMIELEPGAFPVLPDGTVLKQLKAEQPTTMFEAFRRAIITEIARCLNMPANVALGDSSRYNYASGRLDHQVYHGQIKVERDTIEQEVLGRVYARWFENVIASTSVLPARAMAALISDQTIEATWHWPGREHVDPLKEANAQAIRLTSMTTTLRDELARSGRDWEEHLDQRKAEQNRMQELGLIVPGGAASGSEQFIDEEDEDA